MALATLTRPPERDRPDNRHWHTLAVVVGVASVHPAVGSLLAALPDDARLAIRQRKQRRLVLALTDPEAALREWSANHRADGWADVLTVLKDRSAILVRLGGPEEFQ